MIVGAGPIGSALAARLSDEGLSVRVVTRSGRAVEAPGVESIAANAADAQALAELSQGAAAIYNCANPGSYAVWQREWPPLAAALLSAAERSGAVLVTMSNLYGYGPVDGPITHRTPLRPSDHKGELRARMWQDALEAHRAGRVRATEARASDYIGPSLPVGSGLIAMYAESVLSGRTANVFADPDQPHTWTAIEDVAATLAGIGRDERAWGSAWIVPSNPPQSPRRVLQDLARLAGADEPRLRRIPRWVLRAGGTVSPLLREVLGVLYQFDAPFVADGAETRRVFGIEATPWETILDETAAAWSARAKR
nr:NAD-dependent epimerase/dehydratase family protein [Leucobacter weissii]